LASYLAGVFAAFRVTGAEEDVGDWLKIGSIAIFVPPYWQVDEA